MPTKISPMCEIPNIFLKSSKFFNMKTATATATDSTSPALKDAGKPETKQSTNVWVMAIGGILALLLAVAVIIGLLFGLPALNKMSTAPTAADQLALVQSQLDEANKKLATPPAPVVQKTELSSDEIAEVERKVLGKNYRTVEGKEAKSLGPKANVITQDPKGKQDKATVQLIIGEQGGALYSHSAKPKIKGVPEDKIVPIRVLTPRGWSTYWGVYL